MICQWCKRKVHKVIVINEERICAACYYEKFCLFCDPPKLITLCKGHDITQARINRFATDREFTDNIRFEFESGNDVQQQ